MDSLLNTRILQSLFELSIKEKINYQHRNVETKYVTPSFEEYLRHQPHGHKLDESNLK